MTTATYPHTPGHRATDTSREAATAVAGKAKALREQVLAAYDKSMTGMTHDECSAQLRPAGMTDVEFERFKRSVGSRASELKAQGKLEATVQRRQNVTGFNAVVWRKVRPLVQSDMFG